MPQYRPDEFWSVLRTVSGSAIPRILPRSILVALPSVLPYICQRKNWLDGYLGFVLSDGGALTQPFTILVGLLISFRLGDAYKKWDLGARCLTDLHSSSNLVTSMLCCYVKKGDATIGALINIRRLMILACVSIARVIRSQKELDMELEVRRPTAQTGRDCHDATHTTGWNCHEATRCRRAPLSPCTASRVRLSRVTLRVSEIQVGVETGTAAAAFLLPPPTRRLLLPSAGGTHHRRGNQCAHQDADELRRRRQARQVHSWDERVASHPPSNAPRLPLARRPVPINHSHSMPGTRPTACGLVDDRRYPTRNRPAAIFYMLSKEVAELWRQGHIVSPNHHLSVEHEIKAMAKVGPILPAAARHLHCSHVHHPPAPTCLF